MRKRFTLILVTVAVSAFTTAAWALGPTISGVPDVFISQNTTAPSEDIVAGNMFRFTDALTLWDYITTGSTEASSSDKIFWAYAIKDADYATKLPTGSYLTGTAVHYQIGAQAAIAPAEDIDVNSPSLPTVAASDPLTIRNIRLSPIGGSTPFPAPSKEPSTLPGNVLDFQEATLFVTDNSTTPGKDTIFLVTIDGGVDSLSQAGPSWTNVRTYTNNLNDNNEWQYFELDVTLASAYNPVPITESRSTTALVLTDTPNSTIGLGGADTLGLGAYGQWGVPQTKKVDVADTTKLYRLKMDITSSNADATANPDLRISMNGKIYGTGIGMIEFDTSAGGKGPTSTKDEYRAYLWPAAAGSFTPEVMIYDTATADGGVFTLENIYVDTMPVADLVGGTVVKDVGNGGADGSFVAGTGAGQFSTGGSTGYYGLWTYKANPPVTSNFSATMLEVGVSGTTPSGTSGPTGTLTKYGTSSIATVAADKLVVIKANVAASTNSGIIPDLRLATNSSNAQAYFYLRRTTGFDSGPTTTAKDYYIVFDTGCMPSGAWTFGFEAIQDQDATAGTLRLNKVTVTEYPLP